MGRGQGLGLKLPYYKVYEFLQAGPSYEEIADAKEARMLHRERQAWMRAKRLRELNKQANVINLNATSTATNSYFYIDSMSDTSSTNDY